MSGVRSAAIKVATGNSDFLLAVVVAAVTYFLLGAPAWAALLVFLAFRILVIAWSVKLVVNQHALAFAEVVSSAQNAELGQLLSEEGL